MKFFSNLTFKDYFSIIIGVAFGIFLFIIKTDIYKSITNIYLIIGSSVLLYGLIVTVIWGVEYLLRTLILFLGSHILVSFLMVVFLITDRITDAIDKRNQRQEQTTKSIEKTNFDIDTSCCKTIRYGVFGFDQDTLFRFKTDTGDFQYFTNQYKSVDPIIKRITWVNDCEYTTEYPYNDSLIRHVIGNIQDDSCDLLISYYQGKKIIKGFMKMSIISIYEEK
jgi:hypothetical protein